jgi:hypothetical protein
MYKVGVVESKNVVQRQSIAVVLGWWVWWLVVGGGPGGGGGVVVHVVWCGSGGGVATVVVVVAATQLPVAQASVCMMLVVREQPSCVLQHMCTRRPTQTQ